MTATAATARRLLEQASGYPVLSLFLDLDPEQFATAPARATQVRSLLDEANRAIGANDSLDHDERKALAADLERVESFLASDDAPISGARALAVFSSGAAGLFEAVPLPKPVAPHVTASRMVYVEPLVADEGGERWCVTLVSRNMGRIFEGGAHDLRESVHRDDDVHGRHRQGGWSQARYQRSVEAETDSHLRTVAQELYRHWQRRRFDKLFVGGPVEMAERFVRELHNDLRPALSDTRVSVDVDTADESEIGAVVERLLENEVAEQRSGALATLDERAAAGGAAVVGLDDTLAALNERRVETLVLAHNFQASGGHCPACGLLYREGTTQCPADGAALTPVSDLREAAIGAAVLQDAGVTVVGEGDEVPAPILVRGGGIGALLRF